MTFSEKRASKRIRNMLVVAKSHAAMKGMDEKKLIVCAYQRFWHPTSSFLIVPLQRSLGSRKAPDHTNGLSLEDVGSMEFECILILV